MTKITQKNAVPDALCPVPYSTVQQKAPQRPLSSNRKSPLAHTIESTGAAPLNGMLLLKLPNAENNTQ